MSEICTWPGWKCVRLLGEGSFGKVYEIEHTDYGQTYKAALKVISIPSAEINAESIFLTRQSGINTEAYYEEYITDIMKEIAVMSQFVGNTNVVSYQDHMVLHKPGSMHWDILLRMELLTSLPEYVSLHSFSETDLIQMGIDLCRALELCEKHGIIHRDLKLANIFVSDSGAFKLGDFGVARSMQNMEVSMSRKGTLAYMAPEVYYGGNYGHQADIYSLGLVMYTILNKWRPPFLPEGEYHNNDRVNAAMMRLSSRQIPPPATGNEMLKSIVLKALEHNPADRYTHASQMRFALESCLAGMQGNKGVSFGKQDYFPTSTRKRQKYDGTLLLQVEEDNKKKGLAENGAGAGVHRFLWHELVSNLGPGAVFALCAFNSVCYLSGLTWKVKNISPDVLYRMYPPVMYWTAGAGAVYVLCGILAVYVWLASRKKRREAPALMLILFLVLFLVDLAVYLVVGEITGVLLIDYTMAVLCGLADFVFCIANALYYRKNMDRIFAL